MTQAVEQMVSANIVVVAAAGNEGMPASYFSPASAPSSITVGSMGVSKRRGGDYIPVYSNYGPAVDIFAPGDNILAADAYNSNGYTELSGTSMACPHVAGAAAILLSQHHALPATDVKDTLLRLAKERITGPSCSFSILQVPESTDESLQDPDTRQTCENDFSVLLDMTSPVLASPCGFVALSELHMCFSLLPFVLWSKHLSLYLILTHRFLLQSTTCIPICTHTAHFYKGMFACLLVYEFSDHVYTRVYLDLFCV